MEQRNIGIALSGGGIRAMIFHLGFFKWLAENSFLEQVKRISTVSGASLCVGMVYAHNNLKWPSNNEFLTSVMPAIETALIADLQYSAIREFLRSPRYWNKKVNIIAKVLESKWGVHGKLSQLLGEAMWYINCTTYETGKRFRFCRENMGDYIIGYVKNPDIPLSDVMAASAGYPGFIGPYVLETQNYIWTPSKYSRDKLKPQGNRLLHLWDGGIYDNLGIESVYKPDNGGTLSEGVDFLIVSNASAPIELRSNRKGDCSIKRLKRILSISQDQVTALRTRSVMDYIKNTGQGMYIKIGNSAEKISRESGCPEDLKTQLVDSCLAAEYVKKAMDYPTTLKKPTKEDFRLLLRHGFEVAECTYRCYYQRAHES